DGPDDWFSDGEAEIQANISATVGLTLTQRKSHTW
ncbi:MAG: hypothetical protein ACI9FD_005064, partial [Gammaproteobacteria bacterium]